MDLPDHNYEEGRVLAGSFAVIGAVMGGVCLLAYLAVTGFDLRLMFDPAFALTLSAGDAALFRLSMIADCFGFYLPLLALGVYLWRCLRPAAGVALDVGILFLVISTLLGIAGAMLPIAVLGPLAELYASGDAAARHAAGAAWVTAIQGSQYGLWVMEGPTLGFWAVVTGMALRSHGARLGIPLVLLGIAYAVYAGLMFIGADHIAQLGLLVVLPVQVLLMALFGIGLLRNKMVAEHVA
ncbi:MAG: hypothetical protein RJQ08_08635 [Salinisphaeraceae bacterium]